jgi:hypothetical protein
MSSRNDDIDKLFSKKFEKFEVKPSEGEWLELSPKLSRFNFLRFSFVTFNIYYLTVIVLFAGTATFTSVRNIQLSQKVDHLEQSLKIYQKNEETKKISVPSPEVEDVSKPVSSKTHEFAVKKSKPSKNVESSLPSTYSESENPEKHNTQKEIKDTAQISTQIFNRPDTLAKIKVKKIKKTFVIKPRVVIVKKDTVVITKRYK